MLRWVSIRYEPTTVIRRLSNLTLRGEIAKSFPVKRMLSFCNLEIVSGDWNCKGDGCLRGIALAGIRCDFCHTGRRSGKPAGVRRICELRKWCPQFCVNGSSGPIHPLALASRALTYAGRRTPRRYPLDGLDLQPFNGLIAPSWPSFTFTIRQ